MSFTSGETLTAEALDAALDAVTPPSAELLSGTGTTFAVVTVGAGLTESGGTLSLASIAGGSLMGNAGTVAGVPGALEIGANLSLSVSGTLSATGGITSAGSGLTASGSTMSLATIAGGSLMGNAGTVAAVPGALAIGANLSLSVSGTLSATGVFAAAGSGLTASGSTVSLATIAAGSLMGNGGTASAVPGALAVDPSLTINGGTIAVQPRQATIVLGNGISTSSGAFATKGQEIVTTDTLVVMQLYAAFEALVNGGSYVANISTITSGATLGAVAGTSSVVVAAGTTGQTLEFDFSPSVTIAPGTYCLLVTCTNQGTTYALPLYTNNSAGALVLAPGINPVVTGELEFAVTSVSSGIVGTALGGDVFAMALSYRW
jgi:hypothetical protein